MSSEVRVLGATALLTAALVFLAWWLGQHRGDIAQRLHGDETVTVGTLPQLRLPSFSWAGDTPLALPALPPDAGLIEADASLDAGADDALTGTEAELAALLIPAICNRRRNECLCKEYPSRFAPEEERIGATTCEQDTLRDFRIWWRNNIRGPVVIVPEPMLTDMLYDNLGCSEVHGEIGEFLRADAVAGEECPSNVLECRDGTRCHAGRCVRYQQVGDSCWTDDDPRREGMYDDGQETSDWAHVLCEERLRCVNELCEVDPARAWQPASPRRCRRGTFERVTSWGPPLVTECIPNLMPCTRVRECGTGVCAGPEAAETRCVADPAIDRDPETHCHDDLTCRDGTACRSDECVPIVGEGELCERAVCGRGSYCAQIIPGGGQCIARSCLTSHTFGNVEPEPDVEPEPYVGPYAEDEL